MKEQQKPKITGQESESMNPMDQGVNLVAQVVNAATNNDKETTRKMKKN